MNTIKENCNVEFEFTLSTQKGVEVDSSKKDDPLKYVHGQRKISPQLEEQLSGKKEGDKFSFTVKPEDAYGVRDEGLVQFAKKELFGVEFDKIEVGMPLEVATASGDMTVVMAVEKRPDGIVIDGNHPLAGETLIYKINILSVTVP